MAFKSGFVSIIGRPNVGKSTLINSLLKHKIAITTPKAQTTRNNIRGIYTNNDCQIIFVDTPGIHEPQQLLGTEMVKEAWSSLSGVDAVYFLIDAKKGYTDSDDYILNQLKKKKLPIILIINKVDLISRPNLLKLVASLNQEDFSEIIPVSALKADNLTELLNTTLNYLKDDIKYYPEDQIVDYPEQFIIAELVREKIMLLTKEEIPHSVAVYLEKMEFKRESATIYATILVEKDSQKGIIIGKGGSMLKKIGTLARPEIETLLGKRVYLELFVRVEKDWRNRENQLKQLGFVIPETKNE